MTSTAATLLQRSIIALACASTVLPLLGACAGIGGMQQLAWIVLPLAIAVSTILLLRLAKGVGGQDVTDRLRRGIWGGMAGVAGYDLIRVPFHEGGMNPFAAIRSYGMWLSGADQSSLLSDTTGILYHLLNGIGFGIAYTIVAPRNRQAALAGAVVWGVMLEVFAVVSPFADVYHLRGWTAPVILAFFAHLFYGWPLGGVLIAKALTRGLKLLVALSLISALAWLLWICRSSNGWEKVSAGSIEITSQVIRPGWTRVEKDKPLLLHNRSDGPRTVRLPGDPARRVEVPAGGSLPLEFAAPGIYQVLVEQEHLRSAFVIVEQDGIVRGR